MKPALLVIFSGLILVNGDEDLSSNQTLEKPIFRILAPQFLCDSAKKSSNNESQIAPPGQITIGMQTKNGQKLRYEVTISFEIINGFQNQQHTIKIWKSIRMLEKKIKKNALIISESNQIDIDNTELTSGVVYTFAIVGIDESEVKSEVQNFTVTFKNGVASTAVTQDNVGAVDGISLLLIGAEITYADVEYLVEAQITVCEPTNDLNFKWEIHNISAQHANIANTSSKLLRIPPNVFDAGQDYEIILKLFKTSTNFQITQARINVIVLLRGFEIVMVPHKTIIGVDREIHIRMIITDYDNGKDREITWTCFDTSQKPCDLFEPSKTAEQTMRLFVIGTYTVQGSVVVRGERKSVSAIVVAEKDVIPTVRFENFPAKPVLAGSKFQLDAIISDLIPNCAAQWDVVEEEGYTSFDTKDMPNRLGQLVVHSVEENFLSELVDYGNDTLDREITLLVPAAFEAPGFDGMASNAKYKFRLTTVCPKPVSEDGANEARPNITSYTDIVLETNGPPKGLPLEVEPAAGEALKTIFKLSTGMALDTAADYPLKYSFFYTVGKYKLKIGEYYENMVATTELPYSKTPIETSFEVCDSRLACSTIVGPNITTTLVDAMSASEKQFRIDQITTEMARMDYESAFARAIATMLTSQQFNDTTFSNQLQSSMIKAIENGITKLKSPNDNDGHYVADSTVISFVKLSKIVLNIMQVSDDAITSDLLHILHGTVPGGNGDGGSQTPSESVESLLKRRKRATDETETIKIALGLSESLMNSTNRTTVDSARVKLRKGVHQYVERMCHRPNDETFDTQYVKFKISPKVSPRQLITANLSIPYMTFTPKATVQLGYMVEAKAGKKLCVGKIFYSTDLLSAESLDSDPVYELIVMEEDNGDFSGKSLSSDSNGIAVSVTKATNEHGHKCAVWEKNEWRNNLCATVLETETTVDCKCSKLGYFKLVLDTSAATASPLKDSPSSSTVADMVTTSQAPGTTPVVEVTTNNKNLYATASEFVGKSTTYVGLVDLKPTKTISNSEDVKPINFPSEGTTVASTKPTDGTTVEVTMATTTTTTTMTTMMTMTTTTAGTTQKPFVIKSSTAAYVPYLIVGVGVGLLAGTWLLIYCIRRRRKRFPPVPNNNLSILNIEPRQPQPGIRYARFHDEHLMRGDIFDSTT